MDLYALILHGLIIELFCVLCDDSRGNEGEVMASGEVRMDYLTFGVFASMTGKKKWEGKLKRDVEKRSSCQE